jgi:sphingomyelin phosphodiesterase
LIGHIPPLSALNDWGMRFNALTERYSYTLRAQYYGHRHTDHIGIFLDGKNRKDVIGYCFVAPSLQCGKNPQYRVLDVDFDSLQVLDYKQLSLNLTKFTKKSDPGKF